MPYFSYIILSVQYPIQRIGVHVPKNISCTCMPIRVTYARTCAHTAACLYFFIIDFIINIQIMEDIAAPKSAVQKTISYLKRS